MVRIRRIGLTDVEYRVLRLLEAHEGLRQLVENLLPSKEGRVRTPELITTSDDNSRSRAGGRVCTFEIILRDGIDQARIFVRSRLFYGSAEGNVMAAGCLWEGQHVFATSKAILKTAFETTITDPLSVVIVDELTIGQEG